MVFPAGILFMLFASSLSNCINDPMCQECDSNGQCIRCVYSYPVNGVCVATTAVPGCYVYSSNSTCAVCQEKHFQNLTPTDPSSTCLNLDESIKSYCTFSWRSTTVCDACGFGVLSSAGQCFPQINCSDPGCDTCVRESTTGQETCVKCSAGKFFYTGVTPGVCLPENHLLENCHSSNSFMRCSRCDAGYWNENGNCTYSRSLEFKSSFMMTISTLVGAMLAQIVLN